jgi:hypothetical protein
VQGYTPKPNMIFSGGDYDCTGTASGGQCILPKDEAVRRCNIDPNCMGFGYAYNDPIWMNTHNGYYQLFNKNANLIGNGQWTSSVKDSTNSPDLHVTIITPPTGAPTNAPTIKPAVDQNMVTYIIGGVIAGMLFLIAFIVFMANRSKNKKKFKKK